MADEKLNTPPADAPAMKNPATGKATGQAAEKVPAQDAPAWAARLRQSRWLPIKPRPYLETKSSC